jgi:hypothetical protein
MSHYSKIKTKIMERDALIKALADMGYTNVEIHESPQHLFGYKGDRRPEQANVIVRRKYINPSSNDIGFRLTDDGSFEAIVSEYDQGLLGKGWVGQLTQKYAEHAVLSKLQAQGFSVAEKQVDPVTKKVHLVLRRSS